VASMPRNPLAAAVRAAEFGNLEPLRRLLHPIAQFINPPSAPPRKRGPKRNAFRAIALDIAFNAARDDVRQIRVLWREHFGHVYRRASPRATEIAAQQHDLTEKQLLDDRKNRHRRRGR
jgi:hypothetical protein